jgi:hypothetical protein
MFRSRGNTQKMLGFIYLFTFNSLGNERQRGLKKTNPKARLLFFGKTCSERTVSSSKAISVVSPVSFGEFWREEKLNVVQSTNTKLCGFAASAQAMV